MTSLPPSLDRFDVQLQEAIRRDRTGRPRRIALRAGVAAVATCAVALGALTLAPTSGRSAVARAAAALAKQDDSILHIVMIETSTDSSGTTSTTRFETWEQTSPLYGQREVVQGGDRHFETATVNGVVQVYDPSTNTIYTSPVAQSDPTGNTQSSPTSDGDRYRAKILALLNSGAVHETGHTSVDGRDAIGIASTDGAMTLFVDASTFEPIEWTVSQGGSTDRAQFPTYERLPDSAAADLNLETQHPTATINADPSAYAAAAELLTGKPAPNIGTGDKAKQGKTGAGQPPSSKP